MNIYEALKEVLTKVDGKVSIVFDTSTQYVLFSRLTEMQGFQSKDNKIFFWFKDGQKLMMGNELP
jgi:hypothetical protein